MIVLGLDPGTRCGFAVGPAGETQLSGTWDLSVTRGDSPGTRYLKLRAHLNEVLKAFPNLHLVVFEKSFQRGRAAQEIAFGWMAHIQAWCAENRIEHRGVWATTLKKTATGKGNAGKDDMLHRAVEVLGRIVCSDDEADAVLLHHLAGAEQLAPEPEAA